MHAALSGEGEHLQGWPFYSEHLSEATWVQIRACHLSTNASTDWEFKVSSSLKIFPKGGN